MGAWGEDGQKLLMLLKSRAHLGAILIYYKTIDMTASARVPARLCYCALKGDGEVCVRVRRGGVIASGNQKKIPSVCRVCRTNSFYKQKRAATKRERERVILFFFFFSRFFFVRSKLKYVHTYAYQYGEPSVVERELNWESLKAINFCFWTAPTLSNWQAFVSPIPLKRKPTTG